jgi:beta-N-acetylhexosaminidase
MTERTAVIYGWRAATLSADAAAFFRAAKPWGFILFTEACKSRAQVRALADQMREAVEGEVVIFIDQEGGRVARLKAPEWPTFPAAAAYGRLYARNRGEGLEACRLGHRLMAHELADLGLRADCAPCLDLPADGADPIIGDRAFGTDPAQIVALGKAAIEGLHSGGVASVIKHLPGHGRANVDSHLALPRVDAGVQALDRGPLAGEQQGVRSASYNITVRLWVRSDGSVERFALANSTGVAERDRTIEKALSQIRKLQAPPASMPQPITLRIVARA